MKREQLAEAARKKRSEYPHHCNISSRMTKVQFYIYVPERERERERVLEMHRIRWKLAPHLKIYSAFMYGYICVYRPKRGFYVFQWLDNASKCADAFLQLAWIYSDNHIISIYVDSFICLIIMRENSGCFYVYLEGRKFRNEKKCDSWNFYEWIWM